MLGVFRLRLQALTRSFTSTMATAARTQPAWQAPPVSEPTGPPLKVYNSLTRTKTPFTPLKPGEVTWYACGPTVYDDAHLGHARNYVTTDIIRRILRDYFKFKVKFVMNITDVDDKIILRARQQYLLERFKAKTDSKMVVLETAEAALKAYLTKNLPLVPADTLHPNVEAVTNASYAKVLGGGALEEGAPGDKEAKIKMHINTVVAGVRAMKKLEDGEYNLADFYKEAQDLLLPYLDSLHGKFINAEDHSIFTRLTMLYENRFMEDVRALNCLDPDLVTRVTEYGPQIVKFVEKIQSNGFAYPTSDGSVYFDIDAFEKANNHYARLEPWNRNDQDLQADGEGSLTQTSNEKRSQADFALWKSSKLGEPSWASPWGKGRPGWHIECSAMASDVLGSQIDIHSGGIDLAFPHHDNELAQSEAYWLDKSHSRQHQWVNYFLHMGHLSIAGSKMSKSLKNFTTIRDALAKNQWTSRSLRIVFLYGGWKEGIEVTDDIVTQVTSWEERVNTFFIEANDFLRRRKDSPSPTNSESDTKLSNALSDAKKQVHDSLCDSFRTSEVMTSISELTSTFFSLDKTQLGIKSVMETAKWITQMVNIFGLNGEAGPDSTALGWAGSEIPEAAATSVFPLAQMRDELRRKAIAGIQASDVQEIVAARSTSTTTDTNKFAQDAAGFTADVQNAAAKDNLKQEILKLCDRVRDVDLFNVGIYLEDRDGDQPALVRPLTGDIIAARAAREEEKKRKEEEKQRRQLVAAEKAKAQAEKDRVDPKEMFKTEEYSAWDDDGIPTKEKNGDDVTKAKGKKLRKQWEGQKKKHDAWLKTQS